MDKIILDNGVRVITEYIPYVRSATLGVWVESGSRHESAELNGISHFIEHMLFKGTKSRSALDIARIFDSIGGQVNAYTTKEYTCYYARTLDTHLLTALDVLSDMLFNSKFRASDIKIERNVIFEEINMYEDTPEELVSDNLFEAVWRGCSLGAPILGGTDTLFKLTPAVMKEYISSHYNADNTVIAVCGNFNEYGLIKDIEQKFKKLKPGIKELAATHTEYTPSIVTKKKDIEQNHLCLGLPSVPFGDDLNYDLAAICNEFGNGLSSRLFQTLREERGLVYSVSSFITAHKDAGFFGVYSAHNPNDEAEVLKIIMDETYKLCRYGLNSHELERSKELLKANIIMGMESTQSRMTRIGQSELLLGKTLEIDETIRRIDALDPDKINALLQKTDLSRLSLSVVGECMDEDKYRGFIARL